MADQPLGEQVWLALTKKVLLRLQEVGLLTGKKDEELQVVFDLLDVRDSRASKGEFHKLLDEALPGFGSPAQYPEMRGEEVLRTVLGELCPEPPEVTADRILTELATYGVRRILEDGA